MTKKDREGDREKAEERERKRKRERERERDLMREDEGGSSASLGISAAVVHVSHHVSHARQCLAVCCSVLQCVAVNVVCVLPRVAGCCSSVNVCGCAAAYCRVLQ